MKGVVFTEFLEMVEAQFGYEVVDHILNESELESGGAYTSVGTYHHHEMIELVGHLSTKTGLPVSNLLQEYGKYIFAYFHRNYEEFFSPHSNAFDFLESIEDHIHVEVKKLYPDAELPRFDIYRPDEHTIVMVYSSHRKMSDFAEGLIHKSVSHYKENCNVIKELIKEDGSEVKFTITKQ